MKKLFLLFLIIIFASFVSASICCEQGCYPDTQEGYDLKCCTDADDPNNGTAYLGCKGSDLNSYCLNDILGDCLECRHNGVNYYWADISSTTCGACKHCEYGGSITVPDESTCEFDDNYICIGGVDTCLAEGEISGDYCCKSDGNAVTGKPTCAPYTSGNSCFYGSTSSCSSANGWECTTPSEDPAVNYVGCHTTGYLDDMDTPEITTDDTCYYTDRVVSCTQTGWQCTSGEHCVVGSCDGQPDSDGDGLPDVCDTETEDLDCIDFRDNDGLDGCDVTGGNCCKDTSGNGVCEPEEYSEMPAEPDCAAEICSECKWLFCSKQTCEGAYKSSTGTGSCHYRGGLTHVCCDDSDSDNICDSDDNCHSNANGNEPLDDIDYNNDGDKLDNQNDADNDEIGDECDLCPTIKQSESILSEDNTKLCTAGGEITCLDSKKCDIINVGEDFFCDGSIWISINQCFGCFYSEDIEYYWIDNYDKICDLTTPRLILTDESEIVCELLEAGIQNGCEEGETGCWDNNVAFDTYTKCCGDDADDDNWVDDNDNACFNGIFYTDPDGPVSLCELIADYRDVCTHGFSCWSNDKCCGDDAGESWVYSTNNRIDDILFGAGCYNGKWYARANIPVTYYEILI